MRFLKIPDADPRIVGWIVTRAHKDFWKVQTFMEQEDLIHEYLDCYYDARKRYSDREANDPKRFMATVKLMVSNHLPYLQNKNIRMPEGQLGRILDMCDPVQEQSFTDKLAGADEFQAIQTCIAEAPEHIKKFLKAYIDPENIIHSKLAEPLGRRADGTRESFHDRLCLILDYEDTPEADLPGEIRAYLSPSIVALVLMMVPALGSIDQLGGICS